MTIDRKAIADELADQYKRLKRLIEGAIAEAALDPPDLRMTTEQLRYAWGAVTKRWGNAVKRIEPASMANAAGGAQRPHWLGWEDSNSQMSLPKLAFEVWPEFPFISERLAIRDFSRLSCQRVTCTPVQSIRSILQ